jgi:hypothetical protein
MSLTDNLAIVDVWAGSAELRMPEVQGEEIHLIAPLRVGGAIASECRTPSPTCAS